MSFKTTKGELEQGILYRPEDFDNTKQYPVIINYYEKFSNGANYFKLPLPTAHTINIPWFVSNGYIVFTPDIHYTVGYPGESALNSVEGAANYLKNLSWVDSTKIGIQGQSFGGFETNYIVTHSHSFAAAMSSSGQSDLISASNSLAGGSFLGTSSRQTYHQLGQYRLGENLWENPALYINNSPIFEVSQVTTPLLMMNNKNDTAVDFAQGVEFFTALRRLGKRVWMLQYDNGAHTLRDKEAFQHTIRVTQFFDHYLKSKAAPLWMLGSIPAKRKGLDDALDLSTELNAQGKPVTPGPGLLTKEEQSKVDAMIGRKPISVTIR